MSQYLKFMRGKTRICQIRIPNRPYLCLEDARRDRCHYRTGEDDPEFYPCLYCDAAGWIYDPEDPPDVVEGNKMRNRLKCQVCKGTRRSDRETVNRWYEGEIKKWVKEVGKFMRKVERMKTTMSKLSDEEVALLVEWVGEFESSYPGKEEVKVVEV